jgi:putative flippase GtrA
MQPRATPSADASATATWRTLGRHQLGATAATAADFGGMIACVELLGTSPVTATAIGATLGAVTNFTLGRQWIFRRPSGAFLGQATRYALVSAASAGWNTLGEHALHDRAHIQYVLARALVSIAVSLLWNFPLQRRFVFQDGRGQ